MLIIPFFSISVDSLLHERNADFPIFVKLLEAVTFVKEVPQLRRCEVKRCVGKDNYDAVLVSEFASMEDLQTYKDDPRHKAVSALCKSIRIDRVAADYEI